MLLHDIKEDLKDVERALFKMEIDMYGICEETGRLISTKQMKTMPTARTIHEFFYEKGKCMNTHNDIILPFFNLFYSSIKVHCEKVAAMLKF